MSLKISKREGGKGSCAGSGDTVTQAGPATNLTYQLWDATGKVVAPLGNGHYNRRLASPLPPHRHVTVDTKLMITVLAPPATTASSPSSRPTQRSEVEIPFKVPVRNLVEVHIPTGDTSVPLGTLVRVILANKYNGALVAQADKYVPTYPAGLDVYLDSAKTQKAYRNHRSSPPMPPATTPFGSPTPPWPSRTRCISSPFPGPCPS